MIEAGDAPLKGVRVVDMTTAWAGPLTGRILAFLGADTIHIEAATLLDNWRGHKQAPDPHKFPDGEAGARPYNRTALFNSQNVNKRSLTLNLKRPRGPELMRSLLSKSEMFLSNFTPGTIDRLGLGYDALRELNANLIVVEMPAYGRSGAMAKSPAVGPTMEMAAGMGAWSGIPAVRHYIDLHLRWRNVVTPMIAAVQGYCIFGGWMVASTADIVFAAELTSR